MNAHDYLKELQEDCSCNNVFGCEHCVDGQKLTEKGRALLWFLRDHIKHAEVIIPENDY